MDPATHALATLLVIRALFPRRSWNFTIVVFLAGTVADLDLLSLLFGPTVYLAGRNTITHSLLGTFMIIVIACLFGAALAKGRRPSRNPDTNPPANLGLLLLGCSIAAVLHLLLDLSTASGIGILWPFRPTRVAWDLLPAMDPWLLTVLLAGLLLPLLFNLVSSEIGARSDAPRGRYGALIALALICAYTGARYTLHGSAASQLDSHSYRGESPRRSSALPDTMSLLLWHGIVETSSLICTVDVPSAETSRFDSESAACTHKPEPSPALSVAQHTAAVRQFLNAARFPKASVGAIENETEVVVRDLRNAVQDQPRFALAARVLLDSASQVTSQEIVWAQDVHLR